jgi:hypothetical protein
MHVLAQAGPVRAKRIRQWTFYQHNEAQAGAIKAELLARL